jgi:hypothetical protein
MTGTDAPLVDSHAHAFHRGIPFVRDAWTVPDYDFTAEDLIATLDAHGVERAVISGLSITGTSNEYTLEVLRAHGRLRGTAILAPGTPRAEIERLAAGGSSACACSSRAWSRCPTFRSEAWRELFRLTERPRLACPARGRGAAPPAGPRCAAADRRRRGDRPLRPSRPREPARPATGSRRWSRRSTAAVRGSSSRAAFALPAPRRGRTATSDLEAIGDTGSRRAAPPRRHRPAAVGQRQPVRRLRGPVTYADELASYRRRVPDAARRAEIDRTALKLYFA